PDRRIFLGGQSLEACVVECAVHIVGGTPDDLVLGVPLYQRLVIVDVLPGCSLCGVRTPCTRGPAIESRGAFGYGRDVGVDRPLWYSTRRPLESCYLWTLTQNGLTYRSPRLDLGGIGNGSRVHRPAQFLIVEPVFRYSAQIGRLNREH